MASVIEASLSGDERALLARFVEELDHRLADELRAVWIFGSRARGEQPTSESDVDLLVLVADASWDGKLNVHAALQEAAKQLDLYGLTFSFSLHINTPAWLVQRREIESFFIAEVDRDKIVVYGHE